MRKPPAPTSRTPPRPEGGPTLCVQVVAATTERLDRFLADQLSYSRTQAGRLIAGGAVRVNGDPSRASRTLARGDLVEVDLPEGAASSPLKPYHRPVPVVFEDESLLVIDKPAALVVHPAPGHWDDTLVNALAARGTTLSGVGGRPGIVHRLDKDTSGLMIVAKTDRAHRVLARALGRREVRRRYAALIWGHVRPSLTIEAPIARHPTDRKRMAVLATGRTAQTEVRQVARFDACDLVRVELRTGRTHQIRVHLAHVGHPVIGDPVYAGGGHRRVTGSQQPHARAVEQATPRQALHAAELEFVHPDTGAHCRFRAEWPADLRSALAAASDDASFLDRPEPLQYLGFFE